MLATSVLALLSFGTASLAREWDEPVKQGQHDGQKSTIEYTTVGGFFLQDDPATDPSTFDYTTVNYGLLNRSYPTDKEFDRDGKKTQWQRFENYVDTLNRDAGKDTQYKVLFMARHGEGYHNAAESYYGTPAWNCYWGPLDGNGTVVWRDAMLTEAGLAQCAKSHAFWAHALAAEKMPAPQAYYSSPLTRSAMTADLTFAGLPLPAGRPFRPTIKELLREGISVRSCDARSDRARLAALFPRFAFEAGFAEADPLWRGARGEGETDEAEVRRTKAALDDIFSARHPGTAAAAAATWVSLTTHSGQISVALRVLGHRPFRLSTGQAIPALVEARTVRPPMATTTTTAIQSFTSEVTCRAPPATSIAGQGCVCSDAAAAVVFATATPTPEA